MLIQILIFFIEEIQYEQSVPACAIWVTYSSWNPLSLLPVPISLCPLTLISGIILSMMSSLINSLCS